MIFDHVEEPSSISFAPRNQEQFVSGCLDGAIRLWSLKKKQPIQQERAHNNEKVTSFSYSPNGRWLVVGLATVGMCILYEHLDS